MGKTALRLTVISAFAFLLALGMGIMPALAQSTGPQTGSAALAADQGGHELEFAGIIAAINGVTWTVGTHDFVVDATTKIEPNAAAAVVGAFVKVEAVQQADGTVLAKEIEVGTQKKQVEFRGLISAFSATQWTVGGKTLVISTTTKIHGTPAIGLMAEVHAIQDGTTLRATSIEVKKPRKVSLSGKITSINGNTWVVAGRTVTIDASTKITTKKGPAVVGARVLVKGFRQTDGSILATSVVVTKKK